MLRISKALFLIISCAPLYAANPPRYLETITPKEHYEIMHSLRMYMASLRTDENSEARKLNFHEKKRLRAIENYKNLLDEREASRLRAIERAVEHDRRRKLIKNQYNEAVRLEKQQNKSQE